MVPRCDGVWLGHRAVSPSAVLAGLLSLLLIGMLLGAATPLHATSSVLRQQAPSPFSVGVSGTTFTINGHPTFLLGVSYFDARAWRTADLDALHVRGYNLIRIWLDWRDRSFFTPTGALDPAAQPLLLDLIDACKQRGIVVDVTILDAELSFPKTSTTTATAVRTTAAVLATKTNVIYDLVNEHNRAPARFSAAEIGMLAQVLRAADPNAIYTVSSTQGRLYELDTQTVKGHAVDTDVTPPISVTMLAPHLPRTVDWWSQTAARVTTFRTYLTATDKPVPLYLQEEARRGHSGLDPSSEQFISAVTQARQAGAAAWVFHTDAGFDLAQASFFAQLDWVEHAAVDALPRAVFGTARP